jgi:preprotein translocase subunit YajC
MHDMNTYMCNIVFFIVNFVFFYILTFEQQEASHLLHKLSY